MSTRSSYKLVAAVALAIAAVGMAGTASAAAIISNGTVQMGVRDLGDLNVGGGTPANGSGTTIVGLRSVATNSDSTSPGCTCEGWGVGIVSLSRAGYANSAVGTANLSLVSFTSSATTAVSIVNVLSASGGTLLQVKHDYHPIAGTRQRHLLAGIFQIALAAASSDGAMTASGSFCSFHHNGINPQRAATCSRAPLSLRRSIGIVAAGDALSGRASGWRTWASANCQ